MGFGVCVQGGAVQGGRVRGLCKRCHVNWGDCAGVQCGLGREWGDMKVAQGGCAELHKC